MRFVICFLAGCLIFGMSITCFAAQTATFSFHAPCCAHPGPNGGNGEATLMLELLPVSNNLLFLYGNLAAAIGPLQAVLLRSEDGGATWTDTSPQLCGNTLVELKVSADGNGSMTAWWAVESLGAATMFITDDGGRSWRESGTVSPEALDEPARDMLGHGGQKALATLEATADGSGYLLKRKNQGEKTDEAILIPGRFAITGGALAPIPR